MISYKNIKLWIKRYYGLGGNQKIILNEDKMTFIIKIGHCLTCEIEYPSCLKRELKLNELLS
jgi:hypothetical protein